eukprot:scaffold2740_cov418-Prasinococcus_capsulatus_cf.AAC.29
MQLEEEEKQKEAALAEDYEATCKLEEQAMADTIDIYSALADEGANAAGHSSERVICPVCKSNFVTETSGLFRCVCGMEVDRQQDSISLMYFRQRLGEVRGESASVGQADRKRTLARRAGRRSLPCCSVTDTRDVDRAGMGASLRKGMYNVSGVQRL